MINKKERENLQAIKTEKRHTFLRGKKPLSNVAVLNEKQQNTKISILFILGQREIPQVCKGKSVVAYNIFPIKKCTELFGALYHLTTQGPKILCPKTTIRPSFFGVLAHALEGCSIKSRMVKFLCISP